MISAMYYSWKITHLMKKRILFCKLIHSCSQNCTKKKSANLIRKEFLDYFVNNLKHTIVRSSPVSPITDHSLAFVNAGMNQFKGIFLDYYKSPVTKAVNSQKCIRVGGKHNDLSVVGNDSYHHTMFEMLGNWSFGDYFKEEACSYAWNLLINVYGIPKECLYVTYFGGNQELGIGPDLECKDIWLRLGVPECKILSFGMQDNFWEMGISGPCGPCTEIHIDYTKQSTNQAARVNKGYADLMELWNIVFIQYERLANGCVVPLAKHHVDTGMGFERLVALLQGKKSNYDTDLFQPLFDAIQKYSKMPKYKGTFSVDDRFGEIDYGYRILADHARMVTVALADNMLPEQHPKLRKILRNAINIGERIFKQVDILTKLACNVADNLGDAYPELHDNLKRIQRIIEFEEDSFKRLRNTSGQMWKKLIQARTELASVTDWMAPGLFDGYKDLQSMLKELRKTNILSGNVAFKLYDTYGLNSETIAELAKIESLYFDEVDFENQLNNRRYQSRIGLDKYNAVLAKESLRMLEEIHVSKTDDSFKYNYMFDGYNYKFPTLKSKLIGIVINGKLIINKNDFYIQGHTSNNKTIINLNEILNTTNEIGIILDKTPCYSLEGGQVSDKGNIRIKNLLFNINSVKKIDGYVIHYGYFAETDSFISEPYLQMEDDCLINIEADTRIEIMKHHTAAHLLNAAIKQVMQVIYQRGCTINSDSLRFQFNSFGEQLTLEQMRTIEDCINNIIQSRVPITVQTLNSLELLNQDDITLIPGEIYPYTDIRIIEMVADDLKTKEACCGTHIHNTGILQYFCFLTYTSKGAANRIVKAVVGPKALSMKESGKNMWHKIMLLEDVLHSKEFTYRLFNIEINKVREEITDENIEIPLPYLIKEKCLIKLENLIKVAWLRQKEIEKASVTCEITNAIDASLCFIVHCLDKNPTYLSLHEVISLFPEMPILILLCTNGTVKARCSVPQNVASDAFNAQTWMEIVLKIFNAQHGSIKGYKPILIANMKSKQIPEDCLEINLKKAIVKATIFASTHIKKVESANKRIE